MAMSRAQMEEQIKGLQGGGDVFRGYLTPAEEEEEKKLQQIDPTTQRLMALSAMMAKPSLTADDYAERLQAVAPEPEKPNFFELMTELSRSIAAAPADAGPFTAMAGGFNNWSDKIVDARKERDKYRQSIALEAAKLGIEDEREADKLLKDFAREAFLKELEGLDMKDEKYITLQYDEIDPATQKPTGNRVTKTFGVTSQRDQISDILTNLNGVKVDDLPEPPGEGEGDKAAWKRFFADQETYGELTNNAYAKMDVINQAKILFDQIGPENFGGTAEFLLPFQAILADIAPWAFSEQELTSLGAKQALASLTIQFTLANVSQTKGAVSNAEMDLFKRGAPFLGQTADGFRLSLDIQEQAARKIIEFDQAYQEEQARYLAEKGTSVRGLEIQNHMTNWARDWQNSDASKFLTAEQVARLKKFESDAEAEGLRSDLGTYGDTEFFEKRRQDFVDRQRARRALEDQATEDDPERLPLNLTPKQIELIKEIQEDDSGEIDEAQKARLIADIISGART
jgi:hypothetical protein